ncbi:hypothetical protein DRE_02229 [Drechslerella stenobrocha 248]|uniref:Uncharacterized protein n=1 Tax=Drechslerella stenobrocha 248 TaxID=1043628 RepID=W7IGY4_9PEZI|nr:hypothetical protein DRE_02229 [Drechslerella stenobrocha 248]
MGCATSKQELGRRLRAGRRQGVDISWPKDFQHSSLSYPSTLCIECDLPSRALLTSLGNNDGSLCCGCADAESIDISLDVDLKPLSPITLSAVCPSPPLSPTSPPASSGHKRPEPPSQQFSPQEQPPMRKQLPTAYNFSFDFKHPSKADDCVCIEPYYDEYDNGEDAEDDEPIGPSHKKCESFSSRTWKVDHKVVVTAKEVPPCSGSNSRSGSRSNSFASSEYIRSKLQSAAALLSRHHDSDHFIEDDAASTLGSEVSLPKSRGWGKYGFEALNQSSPDLLSASARKSQRVSKDQVKVVRIRGSKSTNWI